MNDAALIGQVFKDINKQLDKLLETPAPPSYWEVRAKELESKLNEFCWWIEFGSQLWMSGKDASEFDKRVKELGEAAGYEWGREGDCFDREDV